MFGLVGFENYRIRCLIGTEPHERLQTQELLVDLKVEVDLSAVAISDALSDTVDYVQLAAACTRIAQKGEYFLIEKYAADLSKTILQEFPVRSVHVCIRKPHPFAGVDYTLVQLHVLREER